MSIILRDLVKDYTIRPGHQVRALDGINMEVRAGEFVAVIGPSGCGKSTMLRLIASLETPTSGEVLVDGKSPAEVVGARRLGMAFQDHALLPWLSTWDNIALPFHVAGLRPSHERISELINLVGLTGFERARPKHLSGGMKQRVALARTLVLNPDVLLLDEPFGSLDALTRRRLNLEMQAIWTQQEISTVLVTHSVEEAVFLADRVTVLSDRPGRVTLDRGVPFTRPRERELMLSAEFHALTFELTAALDADLQTPLLTEGQTSNE